MSLPQAGVQLVAQDYAQYQQQLNQAASATAAFGQAATQAAGVTTDAAGRLRDASGRFVKMGDDAAGAGQKVSLFGDIAGKALSSVQQFAVNALAAAGHAVLNWVSGAETAAAQYQKTMSQIVGLTDDSAQQVQQFSQQVLRLSGDVAQSPQVLAKALYFIASSGIEASKQMEVLTVSAKAASAGLGDVEKIADFATSVINAYGPANINAAQAVDILTTAVKDGKGEPDAYAAALGRVIPLAAAAGVSFDQVAASIATMTRTGLNAAEAVTSLRGIIGSLEKPSVQTTKALQSIGLSADDVRASIREKGLLATLQDMNTRAHGNVETLGKLIPNVRALTGVLSTTVSQGQEYAKILDDMQHASGATDKAFQQATKTMDFQSKALKSTLESLQIELGQALLPGAVAATSALREFAQSLQGQVGPAVTEILGVIGQVATAIRQGFVPVLTGATVAVIAYAAANAATLIPALYEQIATLAISAGAWLAQAAAVLAAAGPFIAIAAAIAAVGVAWTQWQEKNANATAALLESRQWWNDSTAAIDSYKESVGAAKDALTPYAATIQALRGQIEGEIESLAKRKEAGLVSDAQYQTEMAHINQLRGGLIDATHAYDAQEQALLKTAAASQTGTARLAELQSGEAAVGEQTKLTEKELEALEKQIDKTFAEGTKAVGTYVDTEIGFLAKLAASHDTHTANMLKLTQEREAAKTASQKEEIDKRIAAEQTAYKVEETNQAVSYAKQQAANRAHLGQELEDYTLEQVKLGNITGETADKILAQIETQFGTTEDISRRTFLSMTSDIDKASKSGGAALDSLGKDLGATTDAAVQTKIKMDALAHEYTAKLIQNFNEGKIDAEELTRALQDIPRRVDIAIVTTKTTIDKGTNDARTPGQAGTRALGGPVLAGLGAYLVGEKGPELFMPNVNGSIITAGDTAAIVRGMGGAGAGGGRTLDSMIVYAQQVTVQAPSVQLLSGSTTVINQSTTTNMPMTVQTNQSPAVVQQSFYTARALAGV